MTGVPPRANRFEIDLTALDRNVREIRRIAGDGTLVYAALKGNAYGFGTLEAARTVVDAGADGIAVVDLRDAVAIRDAGITVPIHLYAGMLPTAEVVAAVATHNLMPTILTLDDAESYSRYATAPIRFFVKAEVGLERFGVAAEDAPAFVESIRHLPNLKFQGLSTHLHVPKRDATDVKPYLEWQFRRFTDAIAELERRDVLVPTKMAASSGALGLTRQMNLNAIDPGHLIFGLRPGGPETEETNLLPVFHKLSSQLAQVRQVRRLGYPEMAPFPLRPEMKIGVLPIGVVDGMQSLHCGTVLVNGHRCPVLDVSLEHTRIDLTETDARPRDEVVIIGTQGDDVITVPDVVAHQRFRIPAAVPLAVQAMVPRHYLRK